MADGLSALEALDPTLPKVANTPDDSGTGRKKKSGGFQSMGLLPNVLRAVIHRGYKVPTPIQRKCIPIVLTGRDVVGMARTGSGKTAAFLIPLVNRLRNHSPKVGIRGLVLSPSRELALQTLKFAKDLCKYTDLRHCALVGGDSMDEQYHMLATNPDIVVATPGRFLHLVVEMKLDLSTVEYIVFDEADRLFELGFSIQLHEILSRLPHSRQTLLFSATLPKTLVDFAKAGLQEPQLVRLDVESKISAELEMTFFHVKRQEKEAALLFLLRDIIHVPIATLEEQTKQARSHAAHLKSLSKRKRGAGKPSKKARAMKRSDNEDGSGDSDSDGDEELDQVATAKGCAAGGANSRSASSKAGYQTIIFVSTKHHVEYISTLLLEYGFRVSYIYGSLDQAARSIQTHNFRTGLTNILVVTDVAARGIDIPMLENVINYDFVDSSKTFVHRVGRAARAGRRGWAYSLVTNDELPHVLDLQLFLGRKLCVGQPSKGMAADIDYTKDITLGRLPHDLFDLDVEWLQSKLSSHSTLADRKRVAGNGFKLFTKSKQSASVESHRRSKELLQQPAILEPHPLIMDRMDDSDQTRLSMVQAISNFRPAETIFEVGRRGTKNITAATEIMRRRREQSTKFITESKRKRDESIAEFETKRQDASGNSVNPTAYTSESDDGTDDEESQANDKDGDMAATAQRLTITESISKSFRDEEFYISHYQKGANTEKGFAMVQGSGNAAASGGSFMEQARQAMFSVAADDNADMLKQQNGLRWDRKKKRFIKGTGIGSDNKKLIRTENGTRLPASYVSGRFAQWQQKNKIQIPRAGEQELAGAQYTRRRFRHHNKASAADSQGGGELKSVNEIVKSRSELAKRREKHGRHARKKQK
ncbi:ATP-dependent RNA helicase dbp10 [Dimargaris xerosporica]|nr:ATP-dependent RNA helicase dbp10 [Dimargaris xerosporica]